MSVIEMLSTFSVQLGVVNVLTVKT